MFLSFGTNYEDKLFLGATLGIPIISFTENREFIEINDKESKTYKFQKITIEDKLSVHATGINLKLGAIYQPVDFLRVGLAFHTPTYYGNVKDNLERTLETQFYNVKPKDSVEFLDKKEVSYDNSFRYALTTPLRVMLNTVFFIQQRAFISAEYEFTDYSMANMYATDYNFSDENKAIQNKYGFSHIVRLGVEFNINQLLAVRAGYNYISSPYKKKINDGSKHYASVGLGFRSKYFFSDLAYSLTISKEKYWMYNPDFVDAVNQKFYAHRVALTVGVRF